MSRTAVKSIIAKVKETHSVKNKVGRGRKRKISQFLERKIVREVQKNQRTTTKMIVKDLANSEVDVSRSTVKRVLHRNALRDCRPRKTPLLKKRHLQARLKYARDHLEEGEAFWKSVLWSDETKLELFGHMDIAYVWRKKARHSTPKKPCLQ